MIAPALQPAAAPVVILQVFGGDSVKPIHTQIESTVIGVDIFDVKNAGDHTNARREFNAVTVLRLVGLVFLIVSP